MARQWVCWNSTWQKFNLSDSVEVWKSHLVRICNVRETDGNFFKTWKTGYARLEKLLISESYVFLIRIWVGMNANAEKIFLIHFKNFQSGIREDYEIDFSSLILFLCWRGIFPILWDLLIINQICFNNLTLSTFGIMSCG